MLNPFVNRPKRTAFNLLTKILGNEMNRNCVVTSLKCSIIPSEPKQVAEERLRFYGESFYIFYFNCELCHSAFSLVMTAE